MIGSSWRPEVPLLPLTLAEGSQEGLVGTGHVGWVPVQPHSFQARNWSLWSCSGAQSSGFSTRP